MNSLEKVSANAEQILDLTVDSQESLGLLD